MRQENQPSLIQIMACRLTDAKCPWEQSNEILIEIFIYENTPEMWYEK